MLYTLCKHCDHFVDSNDQFGKEPNICEYIHLEDGEQEFDHDAEPSTARRGLDQWKALRPDLFHKHEDGKIGPNSSHHDQRGKIGNPACVECGSTTTPLHSDGVCGNCYAEEKGKDAG